MASIWVLISDAVIIGARSLGFSFQCRHLIGLVLVLVCFSAGTLAQESKANIDTLALECRAAWH